MKARLLLKDDAVPKFAKPRPVPFSRMEAAEKELHHLEDHANADALSRLPIGSDPNFDYVEWNWSAECDQAFIQLKEMLAQNTRFVHYDPTRPITLAADASSYGIGAVISQYAPDGTEEPIAFASKMLTSTEKNYSQLEKEALSIIFGVRKFHLYLSGRHFQLTTDHKPLYSVQRRVYR